MIGSLRRLSRMRPRVSRSDTIRLARPIPTTSSSERQHTTDHVALLYGEGDMLSLLSRLRVFLHRLLRKALSQHVQNRFRRAFTQGSLCISEKQITTR